jgi:hypothetical protein
MRMKKCVPVTQVKQYLNLYVHNFVPYSCKNITQANHNKNIFRFMGRIGYDTISP